MGHRAQGRLWVQSPVLIREKNHQGKQTAAHYLKSLEVLLLSQATIKQTKIQLKRDYFDGWSSVFVINKNVSCCC